MYVVDRFHAVLARQVDQRKRQFPTNCVALRTLSFAMVFMDGSQSIFTSSTDMSALTPARTSLHLIHMRSNYWRGFMIEHRHVKGSCICGDGHIQLEYYGVIAYQYMYIMRILTMVWYVARIR
ncbi:hypothetical protein VDGL01_12597 [Verticillium dahliae]